MPFPLTELAALVPVVLLVELVSVDEESLLLPELPELDWLLSWDCRAAIRLCRKLCNAWAVVSCELVVDVVPDDEEDDDDDDTLESSLPDDDDDELLPTPICDRAEAMAFMRPPAGGGPDGGCIWPLLTPLLLLFELLFWVSLNWLNW